MRIPVMMTGQSGSINTRTGYPQSPAASGQKLPPDNGHLWVTWVYSELFPRAHTGGVPSRAGDAILVPRFRCSL